MYGWVVGWLIERFGDYFNHEVVVTQEFCITGIQRNIFILSFLFVFFSHLSFSLNLFLIFCLNMFLVVS